MGTQAAVECFHSIFEFSQIQVFWAENKKVKQLVYFDYQKAILFTCAIITSTAHASSVFLSSFKSFRQSSINLLQSTVLS